MLTPRQSQLLNFIEAYSIRHGYSPLFQEMQAALGVSSKGRVHALVTGLIERGFLTRTPGRTRSLKIVRPQNQRLKRVYDLGFRAGFAAALRRERESAD